MPSLCCAAPKKAAVINYDNLLQIFLQAEESKANEKEIKKANLMATDIEIRLEARMDSVAVVYNKRLYTFKLVSTQRKEDFGKLYTDSDVSGFYYYDFTLNGVEVFLSCLFNLLHNQSIDGLIFCDSNRDIRQMCHFPMALTATRLTVDKDPITRGEMMFIESNFKTVRTMSFKVERPDAYIALPIQYRICYLGKDRQLKLDDLMNMEARHVDFKETKLTTTEINKLIKFWLTTKTPKNLKTLTIAKLKDDGPLLAGLNVTPYNETTRGKYYKLWKGLAVDMSEAMDIERDDGKLASIGYTESGLFQFVVWNKRFPEIPPGFCRSSMEDQLAAIY